MITYPAEILGCPLFDGYQYHENPAVIASQALKGRPRHEVIDDHPAMTFNLSFSFSDGNFAGWQSFWNALHNGTDWFSMRLIIDDLSGRQVEVHAKSPFTASVTGPDRWSVQLQADVVDVGA